jgi:hypothetical protein
MVQWKGKPYRGPFPKLRFQGKISLDRIHRLNQERNPQSHLSLGVLYAIGVEGIGYLPTDIVCHPFTIILHRESYGRLSLIDIHLNGIGSRFNRILVDIG